MRHPHNQPVLRTLGLLAGLLAAAGCQSFQAPLASLPVTPPEPAPDSDVPRELAKVSLPPYIIEPPDIVNIDVVKVVPKSPHFIEPYDVLLIQATNTVGDQPIFNNFQVDPDGRVDLGLAYGMVQVVGMSLDEAKTAITSHLRQILQESQVSVSLAATSGVQQIAGQHLVGLDGTVNLGTYGGVYVAGMTVPQASAAVEERLADFLTDPEVVVDIYSYNSKFYYLITDGGGVGDSVQRLPITGNETVLDAIATVGGLSQLSSKQMWISRPAPNGVGCEQILPIEWDQITRGAATATNYQLLPGDRLFIAADRLTALDGLVGKITRPFERIFGLTILGTQMLQRIQTVRQNRGALFF
ncbi:MAG: hypothetical protein BMS9Abin04_305 [Planctomycetia bacterium]|nr:MAG: hypothetical protein BMS9Abin04_305 [Planctomycetia bacterium]